MKKIIVVLTIVAVGIAAFSFVGDANANAQSAAPQFSGKGGPNGTRGGYGNGTGVPMERNINLDGLLDDVMVSYIAEELGIGADVLKSREAAGESLVEIGLSLGYDQQAVLDLHEEARVAALAQAVADGWITQEDADWLISRLGFGQYGANAGFCTGDCTPMAQKMMRNNFRSNHPITQ